MLDLNTLTQPRLDVKKAAELIGLAKGLGKPVTRKTVYQWVKQGKFPKPVPEIQGASAWDTQECLMHLGLKQAG